MLGHENHQTGARAGSGDLSGFQVGDVNVSNEVSEWPHCKRHEDCPHP